MKKRFYFSIFAILLSLGWMYAEKVLTPWAGINYSFNLCDGSVIPTDKTVPQVDVDYGIFRSYIGTGSPYQYNGAQHGVEFKVNNYIEIDVARDVTVRIYGCQYSGATSTITVSDKNGDYTETKLSKTPTCDAPIDFVYTGAKTTLKIAFGVGKTYVPKIDIIPGAVTPEFGTTYTYNLANGSLLPQVTTTKYPLFVTPDGILTINSNTDVAANQFWWHDTSHGIVMYTGTSLKFVVPGNTTLNFGVCQYSVAGAVFNLTDANGAALGTVAATGNDAAKACKTTSFVYKGDPTVITATLEATGAVYLDYVSTVNEKAKTPMIDVWDFGAEQLDPEKYNNMLNESIINSWYPDVAAGTSGKALPATFTSGILKWKGGLNDRLRTSNTNLTRYDANSAPNTIADTTLTGSLYVNSGAAVTRFFSIALSEDDELYLYIKSSGGSVINFVDSTHVGLQTDTESVPSAGLIRFVAKNTGIYKIYDSAQKPFYYRILRKDATIVKVTGTVDITQAADIPAGYSIKFTNKAGKSWIAPVSGGVYTAKVPAGFEYNLSLVNANGYLVSNGTAINVVSDITYAIAIQKVEMYTVSGAITGLTAAQLSKVKLVFTPAASANKIYVPESVVTAASATYTAKLEPNCEYTISATGVNDCVIPANTITITGVTTADIIFVAKPVYPVTVNITGLSNEQKAKLNVVFSNKNEAGYVYNFSDLSAISLRDGVYTVAIAGLDTEAIELALTSNLTVNGAAVAKDLAFKPVKVWPFDDVNITTATTAYKGLLFAGNVTNEIAKSHLVLKNKASVQVPMQPSEKLTVTYYYSAKFSIAGGDTVVTTSNSTSKYETVTYLYQGTEPAYVTIASGAGTTYITDLSVMATMPYAATLAVGTDKTYQTVNGALDAVRAMIRPNNERVKIMIDPGNYEEMLVIDVDNVSLVNASLTPSIALSNKGVDIDPNAVRITSYYGHGYNYYSMGTNQKWNADILRVNKENGSTNYVNTGGSTTSGSYWNATVVVMNPGFTAKGIIFENSFNQYISKKESEDVVKEWATGGKGTRPVTIGSTAVQAKSFVERAAAIAITKSADKTVLDKCRVIGRQDSFYGAEGARVVAYKGALMGGTDFIFGGMTLVAYKTDLAMNTSEASTDVSYITAAQQTANTIRGYLMYECHITSAMPNSETASALLSKPGLFGRPWQGTTSEVVFYNTTIAKTNFTGSIDKSMIQPQGWSPDLGGASNRCFEYGTIEESGENNAANRISWSQVLATTSLPDGTAISCFNFTKGTDDWDPIAQLVAADGDIIDGVTPPAVGSVRISGADNRIFVSNIQSNTSVNIYGLDGTLVMSKMVNADTVFEMHKGLWIVKAVSDEGNNTSKVIVR